MIPQPRAANQLYTRAESELAYAARSKKLYSMIWTHVEDVDIRARLRGVAGNGLAAYPSSSTASQHGPMRESEVLYLLHVKRRGKVRTTSRRFPHGMTATIPIL